jgi:hypothetical protein
MAEDFLKEEEKQAKEDLRQLVEHLNAEQVSPPEKEEQQTKDDPAPNKVQFVFEVPDW